MDRIDDIVNFQTNVIQPVQPLTNLGLILCVFDEDSTTGLTLNEVRTIYSVNDLTGVAESTTENYKLVKSIFDQGVSEVLITYKPNASNFTDFLNEIVGVNNTFYGIVATDKTDANIKLISAWAKTNEKLYSFLTSNVDVADTANTSNLATELLAEGGEALGTFYTKDGRIDGAILADLLSGEAGINTTYLRTLQEIEVDVLTPSQRSTLEARKLNYYTNVQGLASFSDGFTPSNITADIIRNIKYFKLECKIKIFEFLKQQADMQVKVPYNDEGIQQISLVLEGVIRDCLDKEILTEESKSGFADFLKVQESAVEGYRIDLGVVLKLPTYAETTAQNRQDKKLEGVEIIANIAGSIHRVSLTANLRV